MELVVHAFWKFEPFSFGTVHLSIHFECFSQDSHNPVERTDMSKLKLSRILPRLPSSFPIRPINFLDHIATRCPDLRLKIEIGFNKITLCWLRWLDSNRKSSAHLTSIRRQKYRCPNYSRLLWFCRLLWFHISWRLTVISVNWQSSEKFCRTSSKAFRICSIALNWFSRSTNHFKFRNILTRKNCTHKNW